MATVTERIENLHRTGKYSDVVFLLKNGEELLDKVKGHRALFAESSDVFEKMLFGEMAEKNQEEIVIQDANVEAFRSMKRFIYTDAIKFESQDHAVNVYKLAKRFNLQLLLKAAENYISTNLSPVNVLKTLEFSRLHQIEILENNCVDVMKSNTLDVVNSDDFLNCDWDFLEMIVNEDNLNVKEIDLFNGIARWAECNVDTEESSDVHLLDEIINKIRFLSMTALEFANGPAKTSLLSEHDRLHLITNIITPSSLPLPERFSVERTSRSYKKVEQLSSNNFVYHTLPFAVHHTLADFQTRNRAMRKARRSVM